MAVNTGFKRYAVIVDLSKDPVLTHMLYTHDLWDHLSTLQDTNYVYKSMDVKSINVMPDCISNLQDGILDKYIQIKKFSEEIDVNYQFLSTIDKCDIFELYNYDHCSTISTPKFDNVIINEMIKNIKCSHLRLEQIYILDCDKLVFDDSVKEITLYFVAYSKDYEPNFDNLKDKSSIKTLDLNWLNKLADKKIHIKYLLYDLRFNKLFTKTTCNNTYVDICIKVADETMKTEKFNITDISLPNCTYLSLVLDTKEISISSQFPVKDKLAFDAACLKTFNFELYNPYCAKSFNNLVTLFNNISTTIEKITIVLSCGITDKFINNITFGQPKNLTYVKLVLQDTKIDGNIGSFITNTHSLLLTNSTNNKTSMCFEIKIYYFESEKCKLSKESKKTLLNYNDVLSDTLIQIFNETD